MNDSGTRPDPLTALPDGLRFLLHSGERIYVSEYGVRDDGVTNSIGGRMSATNDVTKGFDSTQSTQVSLGLAMSEHVRMWRDGEPVLMKIKSHTDCDDLEQVLCSGAVSTRRYGRAHYREVASFDSSTSMICVGITSRFSHASESTIGRGLFIQLGPVRRGGLYDGCWEDVEQYIIRAAEGAQARGEVVVVGRGPNPGKGEPAVLISTSTVNAWTYSMISASPAPTVGSWGETSAANDRATLVATLSATSRIEAATLTTAALREWEIEPFNVAIGFVVPIELMIHPENVRIEV